MTRWTRIMVVVAVFGAAGIALAAEYGTREEARAMLDKIVNELKADEAATLAYVKVPAK